MFNGQFLFDRPMHVKMVSCFHFFLLSMSLPKHWKDHSIISLFFYQDDKSVPHEDFRVVDSKSAQLPRECTLYFLLLALNRWWSMFWHSVVVLLLTVVSVIQRKVSWSYLFFCFWGGLGGIGMGLGPGGQPISATQLSMGGGMGSMGPGGKSMLFIFKLYRVTSLKLSLLYLEEWQTFDKASIVYYAFEILIVSEF